LKYTLSVDGKDYNSDNGKFNVTFDKPGVYNVVFKVSDDKGLNADAKLQIVAGNEPPVVKAQIVGGNKTFFFPGAPVKYAVEVTDKEDGTTKDGKITANDVTISFDYLKGFDMAGIAQGHQQPTAELPGKSLIDKSDCKSCHLIDQKSAGPSYKEVAKKYQGQRGAVDQLAAKIIKGGGGVWGTTEMAAHPQISPEDARKMVEYILSLNDAKESKRLPLAGSVTPGNETDGAYLLTASYFDKGVGNIPSTSSFSTVVLRNPMMKADQATELNTVRVIRQGDNVGFDNVKHNSSAAFKDIDLTGVKKASAMAFMMEGLAGGQVELRLDKPDGQLLGTVSFNKPGMNAGDVKFPQLDGLHSIYVVFKNPDAGDKNLFYFGGLRLSNK
jgi:cytochrome c